MAESPSRSLGSKDSQLTVRPARHSDVAQIVTLSDKVYEPEGMLGCSSGSVHGQINNFPEGQFVVCLDEHVIGYCATFRISGAIALKPHTWESITGNGYASRHDPQGEWLYGMEVYVDPDYRGYRIGQRLYNARKRLCEDLGLRGIVFGGRLPTLARRMGRVESVEAYVEQIVQKQRRDPVLSFQLRNGFEVIGVLPRYLPSDRASLGYAVHLTWRNPKVADEEVGPQDKNYGVRPPDSVRIGTVQYMQRRVSSFEEFVQYVEYFVAVVADYKGDFVVFPELFTLQLLSLEERELTPAESIEALTEYTPRFKEAMREMATDAGLDGAVIVNPYDIEGVAEAMHFGLVMPLDERRHVIDPAENVGQQIRLIHARISRLAARPFAPLTLGPTALFVRTTEHATLVSRWRSGNRNSHPSRRAALPGCHRPRRGS